MDLLMLFMFLAKVGFLFLSANNFLCLIQAFADVR